MTTHLQRPQGSPTLSLGTSARVLRASRAVALSPVHAVRPEAGLPPSLGSSPGALEGQWLGHSRGNWKWPTCVVSSRALQVRGEGDHPKVGVSYSGAPELGGQAQGAAAHLGTSLALLFLRDPLQAPGGFCSVVLESQGPVRGGGAEVKAGQEATAPPCSQVLTWAKGCSAQTAPHPEPPQTRQGAAGLGCEGSPTTGQVPSGAEAQPRPGGQRSSV